jgi:hypothetical protein
VSEETTRTRAATLEVIRAFKRPELSDLDAALNVIGNHASTIKSQGAELAALRSELKRVRGERDNLRAYSQATLKDWPESVPYEEDIQAAAVEHGLLVGIEVREPCGEACWCAEFHGDFESGVTCYRRTELLTGIPAEPERGANEPSIPQEAGGDRGVSNDTQAPHR